MAESRSPKSCRECRHGVNTISGRWCGLMKLLVEYASQAPCKD